MPRSHSHQSALQHDLHAVFERAKLPSSPAIATQILTLISDPTSTAQQFAQIIRADPALAARVMKMSNSVAYAQQREVTTIQRAVTVLGLRQLRLIVLGFELVCHLDRLGDAPFDLPSFWQQSVLRACVAREIARRVVPDLAEEAFVVGLLQDCGILVLVQLLGPDYAEVHGTENLTPTAFFAAEKRSFPYTHVDAIRALASMWGLPDAIAMPLGEHHHRTRLGSKSPDTVRLSAVSYFAGALRFVEGSTPGSAEPALDEYAQTELKLSKADLDACLAASADAYRQVGEAFESLPDRPDVAELLLEANRQLQIEIHQQESRVRAAEAERDQILDEQETLRNALGQYREKAARDPLTGLLNRQALADATFDCITRCAREHVSITVMFIDIDDFKRLNDYHGHVAGDRVLQSIAVQVSDDVGEGGVAGRYGGEEFVVVIAGMDENAARQRCEALLETIRSSDRHHLDLGDPVTCSLGAVWCERPGASAAEALLAAADGLMYQAKRHGKDQCCFKVLASSEERRDDGADRANTKRRGDAPVEDTVSEERFRRAAEALDDQRSAPFVSARKQERRVMLAPCVLRYLVGSSVTEQAEGAYVRNASTGGIGVLTARPLVRGDLVEASLAVESQQVYLAGLVAFCRHVEGPIHEVGIQLFQRSAEPILTEGMGAGIQELSWVSSRIKHQAMGDAA